MRYPARDIEGMLSRERKMILISGPRQVGKTTFARHLLGAAGRYFNWDVDAHRRAILKDPGGFWQPPAGDGPPPARLVLDEIHKFPRWKRFLKGLHDGAPESLRILVTGSGRLGVYQRGGDSLFGRYALFRLHPFTVGELIRSDRNSLRSPAESAAA